MNKLQTGAAKALLFAAVAACCLPWPALAVKPRPEPHIFTPACAAPRPDCGASVCARYGRCGKGHGAMGCLYYFCRRAAH
jgi:hypothetical protein